MQADRDYQIKAIEGLRQGFREGHIRQVLSAPTGSGKSIVMLDMIKSAVALGKRVMFICERRVLVDQFSRHLDKEGVEHGILMAGHWRFRPQAQVQVASAQTLERMATWPDFDIVFIDEIHACLRKSVIGIFNTRPKMRAVGATATPFNPLLGNYFSRVESVIPMQDLVLADEKWLVPFRVFVAHEIDTRGLKVVAGEWNKGDLEKRGQQIVGDVVADYIKLSTEVFGGPRKTICFSCGIAHGADLARQFQDAGINAVQISSGDDNEERAEILADFALPESEIKVVISVAILSRGFDQTDIEHVILARPLRKSFSEHVQMIGRAARPHPGKDFALVQDNSGNWLRFREDWEDFYANGATELTQSPDAKTRKEPTESEKKEAKCPGCGALWTGSSDICWSCGYVRQRRNNVQALPGEMHEIRCGDKVMADDSRHLWNQLCTFARRKDAPSIKHYWRAFFLYRKIVGADAPATWNLRDAPEVLVTKNVANKIKSLDLAYRYAINKKNAS